MRVALSSHFSLVLVGLTTFVLALGLSSLIGASHAQVNPPTTVSPYRMVDPIDARYEAGYSVYLQQCATCHVVLPPAVLPADTWQVVVTDSSHYGVVLPAYTQFDQQLMLNYLQAYSRRHQAQQGVLPYRLKDSRYFQALHPNVELPQPLNLQSCTSCHLGANQQDYSLSSLAPAS